MTSVEGSIEQMPGLPIRERWPGRALGVIFWIVLVFSIISYGGNNPLAVTITAAALAVLAPLSLLVAGLPRHGRADILAAIVVPTVASGWAWLQAIPLPNALSSQPAWARLPVGSGPVYPVITVTPGDVPLGILKIALPFLIFVICRSLFDTDRRALRFLRVLSYFGGIIAIFSIAQFNLSPELLIFEKKQYYIDSLTAPFVNRNTAGTFYGVLSLLLFALLWVDLQFAGPKRLFNAFFVGQPIGRNPEFRRILWGVMLWLSVLTALLLTHSRGAVASTLLGFFVLIPCLATIHPTSDDAGGAKQRRRGFSALALGAVSVFAVAAIFVIFGEQVLLRMQVRGLSDTRFCIIPGLIDMVRQSWPLGIGLTSFREVFPSYRDPACHVGDVLDKAHNFYFEGVITLGIVFPALILSVMTVLYSCFRQGSIYRQKLRFAAYLGFASLLVVIAHGLIDFSLQIPGFTTFYAAMLAPLVTICARRPEKRRAQAGTAEVSKRL